MTKRLTKAEREATTRLTKRQQQNLANRLGDLANLLQKAAATSPELAQQAAAHYGRQLEAISLNLTHFTIGLADFNPFHYDPQAQAGGTP